MAYYHICPKCGAALDPGEKCDCEKEEHETQKLYRQKIKAGSTGQYSFQWSGNQDRKDTVCR